MAVPSQQKRYIYERVAVGEFIAGIIDDIQYDSEHKFLFKGETQEKEAIRFVFLLGGYTYRKYSRWMTFNTGGKSNLYKKYVSKLVANARPDMLFDFDELKNLPVKTLWGNQGDFQNLESIFPIGEKKPVKEITLGNETEPTEPTEPIVEQYKEPF